MDELTAYYEKEYASYLTQDGFDQAMANRLFRRTASYAYANDVNITAKDISWKKHSAVTDMEGNRLYPFDYTITCELTSVSSKVVSKLSWTGKCYIVKEHHNWLVQRLDINSLD